MHGVSFLSARSIRILLFTFRITETPLGMHCYISLSSSLTLLAFLMWHCNHYNVKSLIIYARSDSQMKVP